MAEAPWSRGVHEETGLSDRAAPPRVAILINNDYTADSRAWKIATSVGRAGYDVTVVAREGDGLAEREDLPAHRVLRVTQPRPLRWLPTPHLPDETPEAATRRGDWARVAGPRDGRSGGAGGPLPGPRSRVGRKIEAQMEPVDIWQAENVFTLPLAVALGKKMGGRIVYDANDIETEAGRMARLPDWWKKLLRRRERAWVTLHRCARDRQPAVRGGPRTYARRRVDAVVRNGPPYFELPDSARAAIPCPARDWHPRVRVVLYLGQVMGGRGLDELFEAMAHVDRAVLVVAGYGATTNAIEQQAAASPHASRIRFMGGRRARRRSPPGTHRLTLR